MSRPSAHFASMGGDSRLVCFPSRPRASRPALGCAVHLRSRASTQAFPQLHCPVRLRAPFGLLRHPTVTLSLHGSTAVGDESLCEIGWQPPHSDFIGDDIGGVSGGQRVDVDTDFSGDDGYRAPAAGWGCSYIDYLSWCFHLIWYPPCRIRADYVQPQRFSAFDAACQQFARWRGAPPMPPTVA